MLEKLSLRNKLIAIAAPPMIVLTIIAAYGWLLSVTGSQEDLVGDVRWLGNMALGGVLITSLATILVAKAILSPLKKVTETAQDLAENRLPLLVEALQSPGSTPPEFAPIEVDQANELGALMEALNSVQESATSVAKEQKRLLRQGLSDLVVNMARRNQSLLDRQIEFIDRLESAEEDPDRLEELFGLDHLATRMRRNAEGLLVLANAESTRRRGGPVAVGDVLRVAMSEIEDYRHVQLQNIEDAEIGSQGAVDLAHLLSELMENATQFSPPESPVEVNGTIHPDGSYLISIADHGIGMNEEQLVGANSIIASPPELGLGLSRSLGFIVIGRLAQRLGVRVELVASSGGGVTAIIEVPSVVLTGDNSPLSAVSPNAASSVAPAPAPTESPAAVQAPPPILGSPATPPITEPLPARGSNPFADSTAPDGSNESWVPPELPERGLNSPGDLNSPAVEPQPVAEVAPTPAPTPAPIPAVVPVPVALQPEIGSSAALDKLLGLNPDTVTDPVEAPLGQSEPATAEVAPTPTASAPLTIDEMFSRPATSATSATPATPAAEAWEAPTFDPSVPFDRIEPGEAPAKLDEAIPVGESFEQGMDSLLNPASGDATASGLVKRDRSKSQAPVSEGRAIAASTRSPDEVRSMLARYRDGLKGKSLEGLASEGLAPNEITGQSAANPAAGEQNNPFGEHA